MRVPRTAIDESGAILPLFALLIVVLLAFAALTVDLGAAWAERRHDQNAVDAAVLAAATEASSLSGVTLQGLVDEAIAFAELNLGRTIDPADWANCTDAEALDRPIDGIPGLTPATQCISFGSDTSVEEIRMKLPAQDVPTSFARVIGIDSIPVTAAAQALAYIPTEAASPPFAVDSSAATGDEVCLRTDPSNNLPLPHAPNPNGPDPAYWYDWPDMPDWPTVEEPEPFPGGTDDPCFQSEDEPDASQYFNTLLATSYANCSTSVSLAYNIASGIDHSLSSFEPDWGTPAPSELIHEGCYSSYPMELYPNTFDLDTGLTAQALQCGLTGTSGAGCLPGPDDTSGDPVTPRLQRGEYQDITTLFAGYRLENRPLWASEFFQPSSGKCMDFAIELGDDYFDLKEKMSSCLIGWNDNDGPIFTEAFVNDSARFAFIPQLDEGNFNVEPVHFNEFVPVFMHKVYQVGSTSKPDKEPALCFYPAGAIAGLGNSGWYMHEAGQDFECGETNQNIDRLAAIVLDCGMLPANSCIPDGQPNTPGGQPRLVIELTR